MNSALVKKASNRRKSSRSSRSRKRTKNSQSISFVRKFKKEGKQGLAGICKAEVDGEQKTMVYKTSRYLNYTSLHEYYVMRSLKTITPYCPYFCEVHDIIQVPMSPNFRDQKNPFKTDPNKYKIQGDVLLMNYVKGKNLYSLVKRKEIDDRIIFSAMRQVIGAIMIAQDELNFSHYDLHSSNIIMTPCEPNSISLFISGEKLISSPTYGAQPVVIDFGFSYSDELKKRPIMSSLAHTEFLISLAYESKLHRKSSRHFTLFRKLVKKIFKPLKVDYTSGWDEGYSQVSAIDRVNDLIGDIEAKSQVFGRYNHFALDLIQNMIKLPLRGKKVKDLGVAFVAIDSELAKLDQEIGSSFYNLYMFKKITEIATKLRILYENRAKRKVAVKLFKKKIYAELDQISKYCIPSLNFERLLCGLLVYSDAVEGVLYRSCNDVWGKKQKDYEKMQYNSIYEISKFIDSMLPDKIKTNKNTVIRVTDANNQKYEEFTLSSSEAKRLNKSRDYNEDLFEIYENKFSEKDKINGVRPVMFSDNDSIETYHSEDDEEVVEDNEEGSGSEQEDDEEVVEDDQEGSGSEQEDDEEVVEEDQGGSGSEDEGSGNEQEDNNNEVVEDEKEEQEGSGSEQEGSGSEDEGSGNEDEGSGNEDEGSGNEDEGSGNEQEDNDNEVVEDEKEEQEGSGSEQEGSGSEQEGSGSEQEGSGSEQEGSGSEQDGSGSEDDGSGSEQEGSGSEQEGSGSEQEGSGSEDEGSGSEDEGSGSEDDGSGSEDEGSGSEDEGSGSEQED